MKRLFCCTRMTWWKSWKCFIHCPHCEQNQFTLVLSATFYPYLQLSIFLASWNRLKDEKKEDELKAIRFREKARNKLKYWTKINSFHYIFHLNSEGNREREWERNARFARLHLNISEPMYTMDALLRIVCALIMYSQLEKLIGLRIRHTFIVFITGSAEWAKYGTCHEIMIAAI